jgi:hypothetical protein
MILAGGALADGDAICRRCSCLFRVKCGESWIGASRGNYVCPECQRRNPTGPQNPGTNDGYNGPRDGNTRTGSASPGPRLPNTTSAATPTATPGAAVTGAAGGIVDGINFLNGGGAATGGSNVSRPASTTPGTTAIGAGKEIVEGINFLNGNRAGQGSNVPRPADTKP